ncbi:MAG TPA: response regulator [Candidatus Omnitrophota bacterium]|nr:response regulator [Candidatus Omnitrophota bacterium]
MGGGIRKKILIVDDEIDFLKMMKSRLEDQYDIVTASDGEEALAMVDTEHPDAVLLDLVMEGMDGLEVLRIIRKSNKNLPVFMMTAFSDLERVSESNKLKSSGFIVKTDNIEKQLRCIQSALGLSDKYRK